MVKTRDAKALLDSHTHASRCLERWLERQNGVTVKRIERRLSVANRTLASQTTLRFDDASMSRSQLVRKFRRYRRLYTRPVAAELEWCRPYMAMMSRLMEELEIS
jgi:hypothetical protein